MGCHRNTQHHSSFCCLSLAAVRRKVSSSIKLLHTSLFITGWRAVFYFSQFFLLSPRRKSPSSSFSSFSIFRHLSWSLLRGNQVPVSTGITFPHTEVSPSNRSLKHSVFHCLQEQSPEMLWKALRGDISTNKRNKVVLFFLLAQ